MPTSGGLISDFRWRTGKHLAPLCGGGRTMMWSRRLIGATAAVSLMLVGGARASADAIRVRHVEGLVHGFLVLRDAGGKAIARGELLQSARGAQVTSQLVFYFNDGSLYDETAVFRSEEHTSELQSHVNLVCRLLLEKKKT